MASKVISQVPCSRGYLRQRILGLLLLATITGGCAGTGVTTNIASSDPALRPRVYSLPYDTVWDAAVKTATSVKGWAVTSTDWHGGVIALSMGFNMWTTGTKMTIHVQKIDTARTQVDMQSALSGFNGILMADYGQNRRNVVRFFEELDRTLATDERGAAAIRKQTIQGFLDSFPAETTSASEGEVVEFNRLEGDRAEIRLKAPLILPIPQSNSTQYMTQSFLMTPETVVILGGARVQPQNFSPVLGSRVKVKYRHNKADQVAYALEITSR